MHYCVFVLIPSGAEPESAVAAALEPFDEDLQVEPYRVHFDHNEVIRMAKHFKVDPANLQELAKRMPEWTDSDGGVDRNGLYYLSTCNPDGRFDWYEIGGRWDGYIPRSQHNTINAGTLARSNHLGKCLPYYVLTPDGKWIEHEHYYLEGDWRAVKKIAMKQQKWLQLVRDTLQRWPEYTAVCVDIHS